MIGRSAGAFNVFHDSSSEATLYRYGDTAAPINSHLFREVNKVFYLDSTLNPNIGETDAVTLPLIILNG